MNPISTTAPAAAASMPAFGRDSARRSFSVDATAYKKVITAARRIVSRKTAIILSPIRAATAAFDDNDLLGPLIVFVRDGPGDASASNDGTFLPHTKHCV